MPICTWCGIESKSDLVCDWCKRPLALRSSRTSGTSGRNAVDLLRDPDDDRAALTPRVLAITGIVLFCLVAVVIFAALSSHKNAAEPVAADASSSQEYVASRTPADVAPKPATRTVFLPSAATRPTARRDDADLGFNNFVVTSPPPRSHSMLFVPMAEANDTEKAAVPAVRLGGGVLRSLGGRRGTTVGKIAVTNSTESTVVDFRLEAVIGGKTYELHPFEGTLEKQREFTSKLIHAGEKLTVPVEVVGFGSRKVGAIPAQIKLEAWLDSGPSVIEDEITTP